MISNDVLTCIEMSCLLETTHLISAWISKGVLAFFINI